MADKNPLEGIMHEFADRILGTDEKTLEILNKAIPHIKGLCERIEESSDFKHISRFLEPTFEAVSDSAHDGMTLKLFGIAHNETYMYLSGWIEAYKFINTEYQLRIKDRENINNPKKDRSRKDPHSRLNLINHVPRLIKYANQTLETIVETLPKFLTDTNKNVSVYNRYLTKRFIKDQNKQKTNSEQRVMIIDGEREEVEYVKIKLIDNNPVLTDVLLDVMEHIVPPYRERTVKEKNGKTKTIKEVSKYSIKDASERLLEISDGGILLYLRNPRDFFDVIGSYFNKFYNTFGQLLPYHKGILELPVSELNDTNWNTIEKKLTHTNIERKIKKVKNTHLEEIVQKEEDYLPENRAEKDHFELREKLLLSLYEAMQKISGTHDMEKKEKIAEEAITKAIELKAGISEILKSSAERRLTKNKRLENEYYVGRQGAIGMFCFEREPTPEVKLEEVIGESFDKAKSHLNEIIETGKYPHVMRLSAPGGKVKSNILLIGPYGCGKTELARAVCADERVIGASVSVTDTQTAYLHESVNNVRRVYDAAKEIYIQGREQKPVVLVLDEFNGWFARNDWGGIGNIDAQQIETTLLEILDGMRDYEGIITMAMTNKPIEIPKGIIRRFRYVDIVGQLTTQERMEMLKMYLEKRLPVDKDISQEDYIEWVERLEDAPGDVIRKVVDEVHFGLVPEYIKKHPKEASRIERILQKREVKDNINEERNILYLKDRIAKFRIVNSNDVNIAIERVLSQPHVQMQIETARKVYEEAEELLAEISKGNYQGFGLKSTRKYFETE